jgi:hypothetical protein
MQVCTICRLDHDKRELIEAALVKHMPFRKIGEQFNVGFQAVRRHQAHVLRKLSKAREGIEMAEASTLLARIDQVLRDAQRITAKAEKDGDLPTALQGLRTITNSLSLLGRITGEIAQQNTSVSFHAHQHLHAGSSLPANEAELELEIAKEVAAATLGFDEHEIARLKALLARPLILEPGAFDSQSKAPTNGIEG